MPRTDRFASSPTTMATNAASSPPTSSTENAPMTHCRFLVSQVRTHKHADCEFHVDLIREKHSLFTLVALIFKEFHNKHLTHDDYYSHLWNLFWNNEEFQYGWQDCPQVRILEMFEERKKHIGDKHQQFLKTFDLQTGQKGSFEGRSATFSITLIGLMPDVDASSIESYPKIVAAPLTFGDKLEADWLSRDDATRCLTLADYWYYWYEGENEWRLIDGDEWSLRRPLFKEWTADEMDLMGFLINGNCKFKKSWNSILRFALLDRREGACSQMWYKLKGPQNYRLEEGCGRGLSADRCIRHAKIMAKGRIRQLLSEGSPRRKPHPLVHAEQECRKRGWIDDETDHATKKRRLQDFLNWGRCSN
ncbi:hypothetical protein MPSEU_000809400 [Mayamaea pseudoterrestris]|nr:hypothetical protein MPSEU_000809400 [Mayamaea pseudoterrestris]